MLAVRFEGVSSTNRKLDQALQSAIKILANDMFTEVTKRTPVDTGRAKSGWRKSVQKDNFVIDNAVPYITVLDKGRHMTNRGLRGSNQAPRGIVGPSLESIKRKN